MLPGLVHEQIGLPAIVHSPDEIADEHDMVWPDRFPEQWHLGFGRSPVAFLVVAFQARADEIFPRIFTPPGTGDDMIDGESDIGPAAILAPMAVTPEDVFSRKDDLFERHTDVDREADDAGERHRHGNRMEKFPIEGGNHFRFTKVEQDDRFLDIADTQRLIIMIQYEHFTVNPELTVFGVSLPIRACTVNRCAEVSNTSSLEGSMPFE